MRSTKLTFFRKLTAMFVLCACFIIPSVIVNAYSTTSSANHSVHVNIVDGDHGSVTSLMCLVYRDSDRTYRYWAIDPEYTNIVQGTYGWVWSNNSTSTGWSYDFSGNVDNFTPFIGVKISPDTGYRFVGYNVSEMHKGSQVSNTIQSKSFTLPAFNGGGYNIPQSTYQAFDIGCYVGNWETVPDSERDALLRDRNANITVKPIFSANIYNISYNLDGGSHGTYHPNSVTYDSSFTVSNPTKSGYTFVGWDITGMDNKCTHTYGGSTTTSTSIDSTKATEFKNLTSGYGSTVTFTAKWTEANGSIEFKAGDAGVKSVTWGGTEYSLLNGTTRTYTGTIGGTVSASYTFNSGYSLDYTEVSDNSTDTWTSNPGSWSVLNGTRTVTIHSKPNKYALTINPNGGTMRNGDNDTTSSFNTNFTYGRKTYLGNLTSSGTFLSANEPTRDGYRFDGWTFSGGTGGKNTSGNTFYFSDTSSSAASTSSYIFNGDYAGNVTATAKWELNKYRQVIYVRYENTDGTFTDYNKVMDTDYDYNSTCSWSRAADSTYQEASISYTVEGENTKYITVYRNIFNQVVYVRYQNEKGEWGDYNKVIDSNYRYNSICSWSRVADVTYQAAGISYTVTKANVKYVSVFRNVYTTTIKHQVYNEDTGKYEIKETTTVTHYAGEICTPKDHIKEITGYHYETSDSSYTVSGDETKNVYYKGNPYTITFIDSYHETITYDYIYSKTYTVPTPDNVTFKVVFDYANDNFEDITKFTSNSFKGWKNADGNIVYYSGNTFKNISTGESLVFTAEYNPAEPVELQELKETKMEVPTGWYYKPQSSDNSLTRITSSIIPDEDIRVYAYWNKRPVFNLGTKEDYYRRFYNKMTVTEPMLLYNISNTDDEDRYIKHTDIVEVEFMDKDSNIIRVNGQIGDIYLENYTAYRVTYSITDYGTTVGTTDKVPAASVITTDWYAIEDDTAPVLYTTDKYIYTSNEIVTEKNILNILTSIQRADDAEDNYNVSYWLDQIDSLDITVKCIYYKGIMYENDIEKQLIKIKDEGMTTDVMVTYQTMDSLGNISFAHAYVYFLNAANDAALSASNMRLSVRFINKESLYTLNPDSSWAINPKLYNILVESLNKSSSDKVTSTSVYTTKQGDKVLIRRYY